MMSSKSEAKRIRKMKETLIKIAQRLVGIEIDYLTPAESQIAYILVEKGYLAYNEDKGTIEKGKKR